MDIDELMKEVDTFAGDIKLQIEQKDQQLNSGINNLSAHRSTARQASAFHQFGWVFGRVVNRTNLRNNICHSKQIIVQAMERKVSLSSGRPCSSSKSGLIPMDQYLMPSRKHRKDSSFTE